MKPFLSRLSLFSGILALFLAASTIFIPATPRTRTSLLFSKIEKDQLLQNTSPPRIILIGGSNMSMGIDSGVIKKELGLNPINTAIHATIGLDFMVDNVSEHILPGDIVVVSLEYSQFFGQYMYGGEELLRTVFDVDRSSLKSLDFRQWLSIARFIPKYSISKINPSEYNFDQTENIGVYERYAFNEFGDAYIHWNSPAEVIEPYQSINKYYNRRVIDLLLDFERQITKVGGKMVVTYPAIQEITYQNMEEQIQRVQDELEKSGLTIMGRPEIYIVDDGVLFDTPYHLTYEGAQKRTYRLVEDLLSSGVLGVE